MREGLAGVVVGYLVVRRAQSYKRLISALAISRASLLMGASTQQL